MIDHPIFTDEHHALREMIRAFIAREITPHVQEWERITFPDSVFTRMGELGLLGLDKPTRYGGQGGDPASALVLAEELGRANCAGLAMGISVHTDMAMPPILAFGTDAHKDDWVVPAIRGEKILCLGITEPGAGSDVAAIGTNARLDGEQYVLDGSKVFITNGIRAHAILLLARTDEGEGFTLFLVPMDTAGIRRSRPLSKVGLRASDTAVLTFDDVRVPAAAVVGAVGRGFHHIMWELQGERLTAAAYCLGSAQWLLDATARYARQRHTFGRPIAAHQAIRHKIAEMRVELEAARQLVYAAAWQLRQGDYPVRNISIAKLFATRAACHIADEAMQIHGGAGCMTEYGIERAWRDLRVFRIAAGTDEIMLEIIAREPGPTTRRSNGHR
ncbi:acyl-CoA dehydrogenase family protein [Mycobacterium sp. PDNC021]|uniref:acyl-CoA dehydrogenase family protein n=1 Tax=Mycobacterium sp. PDNC021 TaxID=3391399 RepID=UPI003AAD7464